MSLSHPKLNGIFPALTTSFDYDGALYKTKVLHNVSKLNDVAVAGYLVCGSAGETPLLSFDERVTLLGWVREAAGEGKTLIAGVIAESVAEAVRMANIAADLGYHFALVLTPHFYRVQMRRPETQSLFFRAVADRSRIPVLIYSLPQLTGYSITVDTVAALSHHPNIAGMKDSSGDLSAMKANLAEANHGFQMLSGSDSNFREALHMGCTGAILPIANVLPYACITIWEAVRRREPEAADDWQARILPAAQLIASKYGIPGLKHAMDLNGFYGGAPRLPFTPVSSAARAELEDAFRDLLT